MVEKLKKPKRIKKTNKKKLSQKLKNIINIKIDQSKRKNPRQAQNRTSNNQSNQSNQSRTNYSEPSRPSTIYINQQPATQPVTDKPQMSNPPLEEKKINNPPPLEPKIDYARLENNFDQMNYNFKNSIPDNTQNFLRLENNLNTNLLRLEDKINENTGALNSQALTLVKRNDIDNRALSLIEEANIKRREQESFTNISPPSSNTFSDDSLNLYDFFNQNMEPGNDEKQKAKNEDELTKNDITALNKAIKKNVEGEFVLDQNEVRKMGYDTNKSRTTTKEQVKKDVETSTDKYNKLFTELKKEFPYDNIAGRNLTDEPLQIQQGIKGLKKRIEKNRNILKKI